MEKVRSRHKNGEGEIKLQIDDMDESEIKDYREVQDYNVTITF